MALNKEWVKIKNRSSKEYREGVNNFLDFGFETEEKGKVTIRYPCDSRRNLIFLTWVEVRLHLLRKGMYEKYSVGTWEFHGEDTDCVIPDGVGDEHTTNQIGLDDSEVDMLLDACAMFDVPFGVNKQNALEEEEHTKEAATFFRLLKQYQEPLTTNGSTMSKLSYIVKLLHLKVLNHWSDISFDSLLKLHAQAWGTSLPTSYQECKKIIRDLGLDCVKIDACRNDCVLFWKENAGLKECPTCRTPRHNVKILRHFPLKSRLQRLFMSRRTAKDMVWHVNGRSKDGVMRHPVDYEAWKSFMQIEEHDEFAKDGRNVMLGLGCDGFQPFRNSQHSICPVIMIPYNLPPWICMKPHSFILSLLIPGPSSPGRDLDVYLQLLADELKELWEVGVDTYDAYTKTNFNLHASLLWTISDFPAYSDLSGWQTKGSYACPNCHKETCRTSLLNKGGYLCHHRWLPRNHIWRDDVKCFDKTVGKRSTPMALTGEEIVQEHKRFRQDKFGKVAGKKRKKVG